MIFSWTKLYQQGDLREGLAVEIENPFDCVLFNDGLQNSGAWICKRCIHGHKWYSAVIDVWDVDITFIRHGVSGLGTMDSVQLVVQVWCSLIGIKKLMSGLAFENSLGNDFGWVNFGFLEYFGCVLGLSSIYIYKYRHRIGFIWLMQFQALLFHWLELMPH